MNAVVSQKSSAVPFLKKITPKTVTEKVGIDLLQMPRPVEARTLYDLFGQVVGVKTGMTNLGSWTKFTGRFQAVTPDGEVFDSSAAHVPVLEDLLHNALLDAQQKDPRARLEIALRIRIVPAPSGKPSATGYEFQVDRLIPEAAGAEDPIAKLRALAAGPNAPQLPAPAAGPVPGNGSDDPAGNKPARATRAGHVHSSAT